MESKIWYSPDKSIKKEIIGVGVFGPKPTECAVCQVKFFDIKLNNLSEYLENTETVKSITLGEANTLLDRKIDEVLLTMKTLELSLVSINVSNLEQTFKISLVNFESKGFIYEWVAEEKCKIALHHKQEGIELFKKSRFIDASHRFSRGLKLLLSIPVPVDEIPDQIDDILLTDLNKYKANLYNNLASCYAKENKHNEVIDLCTKVLQFENNNVKAMFKRGFAYSEIRDFEKAKSDLENVLEQENDNKAAIEKLNYVNSNISNQEASYACIVKKMFGK